MHVWFSWGIGVSLAALTCLEHLDCNRHQLMEPGLYACTWRMYGRLAFTFTLTHAEEGATGACDVLDTYIKCSQ